MSSKKKKIDYNKRMEAIAGYVDFKHDRRRNLNTALTASEKKRLSRVYNILRPKLISNNQVERPRSRNKKKRNTELRALQLYAQHQGYSKHINVALIPLDDGVDKIEVLYDGQAVITKSHFVHATFIAFDNVLLALDPIGHTEDVIAPYPGAKSFRIRVQSYHLPGSYDRAHIGRKMATIVAAYLETLHRFDGLTAYAFDNQQNFDNLRRKHARTQARKKKPKARPKRKVAAKKVRKRAPKK